MNVLSREKIAQLIKKNKLIEGYVYLDTQLTPNGFDLTAGAIYKFSSAGALDFSNNERKLPICKELKPQKFLPAARLPARQGRQEKKKDKFGWWDLKPGIYKVSTNEVVNLPLDLIAIAFSRTSLLRMGAFTEHGAWDAGFKGRSEFALVVENPKGLKIKQNARIAQLIFLRVDKTKQGYNGIYKNL